MIGVAINSRPKRRAEHVHCAPCIPIEYIDTAFTQAVYVPDRQDIRQYVITLMIGCQMLCPKVLTR
jgi:hypothetical protein